LQIQEDIFLKVTRRFREAMEKRVRAAHRRASEPEQVRELQEELGITGDGRIYGSVIIGYPKAIPAMPERKEPKYLKIIE